VALVEGSLLLSKENSSSASLIGSTDEEMLAVSERDVHPVFWAGVPLVAELAFDFEPEADQELGHSLAVEMTTAMSRTSYVPDARPEAV
jgi:hypothetical protein